MQYKDYMKMPEVANDFYKINTTRAPMDKVEVRKAFNMAIDKNAYAAWRKTVLPLTAFTPEGAFVGYPQPRGDQFNPLEAKRLLASAGYRDTMGSYDASKFPLNEVEILYNTHDTNKAIAEFVQAQWKQNLNLTVPIRAMEWKTFLSAVKKLEYKGFARGGWNGDYMDPYTFLGLFYNKNSNSDTGWTDMAYTQLLDEANRQLDGKKRYELLARAEAYLLNAQPFVSLSTPSTNFMKKPYVKGMYPNPASFYAWKFVYIADKEADWDKEPPKMTE
jgi:oligopeptide transport system substrate-binding protein